MSKSKSAGITNSYLLLFFSGLEYIFFFIAFIRSFSFTSFFHSNLGNIAILKSSLNPLLSSDVNSNFDFSASFNAAIEAKVTAEQSALAARNKLEQIKFEAEQKVASATAEATALRLQKEQI